MGGAISWVVVGLMATFMVATVAYAQFFVKTTVGGDATAGDLMQMQIQAKVIVGQNNLTSILPIGDAGNVSMLPKELNGGAFEQRLCYAILKNELEGPQQAIKYLETELDPKVEQAGLELTDRQKKLRNTLGQTLSDYAADDFLASNVPAADVDFFKKHMGYCGKVAFLPKGSPKSNEREAMVKSAVFTILGMAAIFLLALLVGFFGVVMLVVTFVAWVNGNVHSRIEPTTTNHNIYIETFAIWMLIFFGSSLVMQTLDLSRTVAMMIQPVVFFGSLLALFWPKFRGISFKQIRHDIGWTSRRPLSDAVSPAYTYPMALPVMIPGFIFVFLFSMFVGMSQPASEFARQATPGHPIQEYIASGDWLMILMVFITACIAAPVVEETMFRGVLYRHLRDMTRRNRLWFSVLLSTIVNAFIFAAIHPQGIVAIPVLMSLAICFSLTREWRGNLIAPMIMHAIHNSLITVVTLIIL